MQFSFVRSLKPVLLLIHYILLLCSYSLFFLCILVGYTPINAKQPAACGLGIVPLQSVGWKWYIDFSLQSAENPLACLQILSAGFSSMSSLHNWRFCLNLYRVIITKAWRIFNHFYEFWKDLLSLAKLHVLDFWCRQIPPAWVLITHAGGPVYLALNYL